MQNRTVSPRLLAVALCTGLGLAALAAPAAAQTIGYNVRTGDVWVDNRLDEINRYGHDYRDPFIGELTGQYGAPRSLIVDLLDRRGWAPADVYYACAIASAARPRPVHSATASRRGETVRFFMRNSSSISEMAIVGRWIERAVIGVAFRMNRGCTSCLRHSRAR